MSIESASRGAGPGPSQLYGIMGHPIGHSLSPLMHTLAFRHHGLDAVYLPFSVAPEDLGRAVGGGRGIGDGGI